MMSVLFFYFTISNRRNMALINMREVYPGVTLGLWQMDETVDDFFDQYPWLGKYRTQLNERYKNDGRKKEFLAIRALLREMLGDKTGELTHNEAGKPMLKGYHVSVSHTQGFAALIVSKTKEVGVDVEYISDRVKRIASKFMRKDEKASDVDSLLVHWCAKETVYKIFSEQNLQYEEMRVKPFNAMSDWMCEVENLKSGKKVGVDFELTMEFVLTYAAL